MLPPLMGGQYLLIRKIYDGMVEWAFERTLTIDEHFGSLSVGPKQYCFIIYLLVGNTWASFHGLQQLDHSL